MKSVPINTLIPPNHKELAWIQAIDWEQVERRVAERFAQIGPPKDAPLPTRLAVALAIFNYKTGYLPEDAPHAWSETPIYQFLSGATHYEMELPCDPAVYCRWRKHFGEAELEVLIDSLGVVPRAQRKHTSLHYALSFEDTLTQLQEGLQSPPATRKDDSQKQEAPHKAPGTQPKKAKGSETQPFLPGFPQDDA